jgi:hypothetical protein
MDVLRKVKNRLSAAAHQQQNKITNTKLKKRNCSDCTLDLDPDWITRILYYDIVPVKPNLYMGADADAMALVPALLSIAHIPDHIKTRPRSIFQSSVIAISQ